MGIQKPTSMRMVAWIGKNDVSLLADTSYTFNVINSNIVNKVVLTMSLIMPIDVKMAKGERLKCKVLVKDIKINIHGVRIVVDLHVIPLVWLDMVFENVWLRSIGKVGNDYHNMSMDFNVGSIKCV